MDKSDALTEYMRHRITLYKGVPEEDIPEQVRLIVNAAFQSQLEPEFVSIDLASILYAKYGMTEVSDVVDLAKTLEMEGHLGRMMTKMESQLDAYRIETTPRREGE